MKIDGEDDRECVELVGSRTVTIEPNDRIWGPGGYVPLSSFRVVRKDGRVVGIKWVAENIKVAHAIESADAYNACGLARR